MSSPEGSRLKIDVIIATRNRPLLLSRCVRSLVASQCAAQNVHCRILICSSGDGGESQWEMERLKEQFPDCPILILNFREGLSAAAARNLLLPLAEGDWLFFIDDDAFVDPEFFAKFKSFVTPQIKVVGGPNLTPLTSNSFQRASGAVLASRFGAAYSRVRYKQNGSQTRNCGEESLILCNLFVRREAMGLLRFNESLTSNEENWLLQDLARAGNQLIYAPNIFVWHERRTSLDKFAQQIYRYGIGRGEMLRVRPRSTMIMHLFPTLCISFSLMTLLVFPWRVVMIKIWLLLAAGYLSMLILAVARSRTDHKHCLRSYLFSFALFPVIHLSYGLGVLRGLSHGPSARGIFEAVR